MTNQLAINFSHRHYTNFDRDKFILEKSSIKLLWMSGINDQDFLCKRRVKDIWNYKAERGLKNRKSYIHAETFPSINFCQENF